MSQHIDAIYSDGAFHPQQPVHFSEGEHVSLLADSKTAPPSGTDDFDDLSDIQDLLSQECVEECRRRIIGIRVPSIEEVREMLSVYKGSLADDLAAERDER